MKHGGKLVIVVICLIALAAAIAARWYLSGQSRRALRFWGAETARLIIQAPQVELLRIAPADDVDADQQLESQEILTIQGRDFRVVESRDGRQAPGLINVRRGLVTDTSFGQLDIVDRNNRIPWSHAIRFQDGSESVVVAIAFELQQVVRVGDDKRASVAPVAEGLKRFFEERLPGPSQQRGPEG
jgi:hypothetical protein